MASANNNRIIPLSSAAIRVKSPKTSANPNNISECVEVHANGSIKIGGKNQFSFPV
jgi:hypothetical protein